MDLALAHDRLARPRAWLDGVVRSYSQVLFTDSRLVGVLLMLATALEPALLLHGLLAALLAMLTTTSLKLSQDVERAGLFSYNALLVGLGCGALLQPGVGATVMLVAGVLVTVVLTAAMRSALSQFSLPVLTMPFVATFSLILVTAPYFGIPLQALYVPPQGGLDLPGPLALYLESLGTIFFLPRPEVGALVLLALVLSSRIATLLSLLALALAWLLGGPVVGVMMPGFLPLMTLNVIFAAIAIGGIWFIPSPSSFSLATIAILLTLAIAVGSYPLLSSLGLSISIAPFNLAVWILLFAMRQRLSDSEPKSVTFAPGSPEANLSYWRARVARFGARYLMRFHAPFRGRWICTQSHDGEHTHKGPWRHGLDFEVAGADGEVHSGDGSRLEDYHCYGLPVLATAAGTVVRVIDNVADNPPGEVNLEANWGNVVVLYHAPGLYSVVAHLKPHSAEVREGQIVQAGAVLGKCGSSGRSPVPHLHFQLQATAVVGAPTLYTELHDVIAGHEGDERLVGTAVPAKGEALRNITLDSELMQSLRMPAGAPMTFEVLGRRETITPELDLLGNWLLRSDRDGVLYYDLNATRFVTFDVLGNTVVLHLMRIALGRVALELREGLVSVDHLPYRYITGPGWRALIDTVAAFLPSTGLEMTYEVRRDSDHFVIAGRSRREDHDGTPRIATRAELHPRRGLQRLELTRGGRTFTATRVDPSKDSSAGAKA